MLSHDGIDKIIFTEVNGVDFSGYTQITNVSDDLDGGSGTNQIHIEGQKRIDTITLSGTGGTADITCDGLKKRCIFTDTLTGTAEDFVIKHASAYLAYNVIVTSSGANIIFTARYTGEDFAGSTIITNIPSVWSGAVSIAGNEIWDDKTNNSQFGAILINMKGYNGGTDYYRSVVIGNGKGLALLTVGHAVSPDEDIIVFGCGNVLMGSLPRSNSGLFGGQLYADANGFVKIAPY
jgi:hypothetical protein